MGNRISNNKNPKYEYKNLKQQHITNKKQANYQQKDAKKINATINKKENVPLYLPYIEVPEFQNLYQEASTPQELIQPIQILKFNPPSAGSILIKFILCTTVLGLMIDPTEAAKRTKREVSKDKIYHGNLNSVRNFVVVPQNIKEMKEFLPTRYANYLKQKKYQESLFEFSIQSGINKQDDKFYYLDISSTTAKKMKENKEKIKKTLENLKKNNPSLKYLINEHKIKFIDLRKEFQKEGHYDVGYDSELEAIIYKSELESISVDALLRHELDHNLWHEYHKTQDLNTLSCQPIENNFNEKNFNNFISKISLGKKRIANYISL